MTPETNQHEAGSGCPTPTCSLSVGDRLAFRSTSWGQPQWEILKVSKITPTGRIKCGRFMLNPDLTVRGRGGYHGPYRGELVTDEILSDWRRQRDLTEVQACKWSKLAHEVVAQVAEILRENAGGDLPPPSTPESNKDAPGG